MTIGPGKKLKYDEGELVHLKKIYIDISGYSQGWYLVLGSVIDMYYVCLEPGGHVVFIDEGMIDKRRKWRKG